MCRVRTAIVMEDDELLVLTTLYNFRRSCGKLCFHLIDYGQDDWCKQGEYEDVNLLCPRSVYNTGVLRI